MPICAFCGKLKFADEIVNDFKLVRNRNKCCFDCADRLKKQYKAIVGNREKFRELCEAYGYGKKRGKHVIGNSLLIRQASTPDEIKHNYLWGNYRISLEQYYDILRFQDWKCAICKSRFEELENDTTHVDFDQSTGKVRGVLCRKCNAGLGGFNDKVKYLEEAAKYLIDPPADHVLNKSKSAS